MGIDPGYGESGVLLRRDDEIIQYGLVKDKFGASTPTVFRSQAVAARIVGKLADWIHTYSIDTIDISIELPVYTTNAKGFGKQMTLVQAIQSMIIIELGYLHELWITEVGPSESKKLSTGNGAASKQEILANSPFAHNNRLRMTLPEDSLLTLADAWSHSLAAWKKAGDRFDAKMMKWPTIKER